MRKLEPEGEARGGKPRLELGSRLPGQVLLTPWSEACRHGGTSGPLYRQAEGGALGSSASRLGSRSTEILTQTRVATLLDR